MTVLIAQVTPILRDVEEEMRKIGGHRFVARIDPEHAVKSPASILEKMARAWVERPDGAPPVSFTNFTRELKDLGRFRIVANFLSDVELIADRLEAPYSRRPDLSVAQKTLATDYHLTGNAFENEILRHPRDRKKGERCRKGVFEPSRPEQSHLRVEVQIQTLLQEAWDKKDHYLLYEPRRRGEAIALEHECEMFAMSELLYVADLTFDRLRENRRRDQPSNERKGDANARS